MKETFATRSVNFDFQGPIFRLFSHKVVRNCYLIFILHTMFFYEDILELTQATKGACSTAITLRSAACLGCTLGLG